MKYICTICKWVYDEEKQEEKFEDLPESYKCPFCGAEKKFFEKE